MASARARASPTVCGRNQVPPRSGISEMRTKAWSKRAERAASTMSQASAKLAPPPAATPLIAPTIGLGSARMARIIGLKRRSMSAPRSGGRAASGSPVPPPARSAPAQKPRPVPVSSTARIVLVVAGARQLAVHRLDQGVAHGVQPLRAVERQGEHAAFEGGEDGRFFHGAGRLAWEALAATLPAPSGRVAARHALAYLRTRWPRS